MSLFRFRYPEWVEVEPSLWVQKWAGLYELRKERKKDDCVYKVLIEKNGTLSGDDFELVGRWKEGCFAKTNGRWKTKTTAAYDVWMQARNEPPKCPVEGRIADFLEIWCERKFASGVYKKSGQVQQQRFGLSRASALLHFISVGRFPIYDGFTGSAIRRLGSRLPCDLTIDGYLNKFCPLFSSIANDCGLSSIDDLRRLDNALRCYGAITVPISKIAEPGRAKVKQLAELKN